MGDPAGTILKAERRLAADVVIMATHGRRGFKRVFLGSVAEMVLRESICPVLTVRQGAPEGNLVARWMTASPMTATPEEKLSAVATRMDHGGFRGMPVLKDGKVIGMITDRDLRRHTGYLDQTEVSKAMSERVLTVTPETTIYDAARLLREHKIGALPVVEDGRLVGMISTTDVLEALSSETQ
jgi:acetoin utilization protein AcuB